MVDILERLQSPQTSLGTLWPQPNLHEEAADEITRLREENAAERLVAKDNLDWFNALKTDYDALREENARLAALSAKASLEASQLREALEPFARAAEYCEGLGDLDHKSVLVGNFRAAAAAIQEGGKDEN